jgi:hypothetical protein
MVNAADRRSPYYITAKRGGEGAQPLSVCGFWEWKMLK